MLLITSQQWTYASILRYSKINKTHIDDLESINICDEDRNILFVLFLMHVTKALEMPAGIFRFSVLLYIMMCILCVILNVSSHS